MQAQTIAQVKAQAPESLWHFLVNLPSTMEAQIFYALLVAGTVGMLSNYLVKWAKNEIAGGLINYLVTNSRATALSLFTYVGISCGAIYGQAFHVGDSATFVGWGLVLWLGLINGYGIDNIVNKGARPVWSAERRSAAREDAQ